MARLLLSLLLAVPLFAQLPPGVSRVPFRDDVADAWYLAATGDVLWVGSVLDDAVHRIDVLDGSRTVDIPLIWQNTTAFAAGPDGALWLGSSGWIARVDHATNELDRWAIGPGGAQFIASGPDGNVWFVQRGSVFRMRPDGAFVSAAFVLDDPRGAAFGSDGALYLTAPGKLVRFTASGERTEFPAASRSLLFAGAGFLWSTDVRSGDEATATSMRDVVKLSDRGETIATYRVDLSPIASDAGGNLWLRGTTAAGDVVAQLSPSGVLTRFGPIPPPVSTECHPRWFGGLTFLSDGRVAMTDYYRTFRPMVGPCAGVERPENAKNTITLLDPRLAPVLSIDSLGGPLRRRASRH